MKVKVGDELRKAVLEDWKRGREVFGMKKYDPETDWPNLPTIPDGRAEGEYRSRLSTQERCPRAHALSNALWDAANEEMEDRRREALMWAAAMVQRHMEFSHDISADEDRKVREELLVSR